MADADERAREIRREIRRLRREPECLPNRRQIRKLYEQLDTIQFKPDYLCIIMDKKKDYIRACKGFSINGNKYQRLLGTNGGIKNETIVFVSERVKDELGRRIENGRDLTKELVPAKLEAYKALVCSASIPVSMPRGIIVVNDCETEFLSDVTYISDELDGEPVMEERKGALVKLNASDGCGIMLPSLAQRWGAEIGINYVPGGVNTRFAWEKGMAFCFDFLDFAEKIAGAYVVRDAWGAERDVREAELILTTSMLKLWDSYSSMEEYLESCADNGYEFGISKVCPKELEDAHTLNYQFIQSYDLSDADIDELIAPTMNEIRDVLYADYRKTILFLKGAGLNESNIDHIENDFAKALMVDQRMLYDPYVQNKIYQFIKKRIDEAKAGAVTIHGNYSVVSGDLYALCQSVFGMAITGILEAGEIYNAYWADGESDRLVGFRAPMTHHGNIRSLAVNRSGAARYWYQHVGTATVLNAWDTAAMAWNGLDFDGDLLMLTDNPILMCRYRSQPALMCIQRLAAKRIVAEGDLIKSNLDSFGNEIGVITNRITSMFEVQAHFPVGSDEYRELDYRIKCGQLLQQNSIDKSKGIISKPMPHEWYDRHAAARMEDPEKRRLYMSILADKKPYFMCYIYPDLMGRYTTYIRNTDKKAQREFDKSIGELRAENFSNLSEGERNFLKSRRNRMPVGMSDCVMNRICRKFEQEFDGFVGRHSAHTAFDYTIMTSGAEYSRLQFAAISRLLEEYNERLRDYVVFVKLERVDEDEAAAHMSVMRDTFRSACDAVCSNAKCLCDILLDICYQRSCTKQFVWDMCGKEIVSNLLDNNGNMIHYPVLSADGDIEFSGNRFSFLEKELSLRDA